MPPARQPNPEELKNLHLMVAIRTAPDTTIRTVLRALCADPKYKLRIRTLMLDKKLPLKPEPATGTTAAGGTSDSSEGSKKRKASRTEICVQCDQLFEEGDKSKTCKYHPHDMELDDYDESWQEMPIFPYEIQDNEFCRTENPGGFVYPCCDKKGTRSTVNNGCMMGRHRAADGKRTKFPGTNPEDSSDEEGDKENKEHKKRKVGGKKGGGKLVMGNNVNTGQGVADSGWEDMLADTD